MLTATLALACAAPAALPQTDLVLDPAGASGRAFGAAIDADGDLVAVGARGDLGNPGVDRPGAAVVFDASGTAPFLVAEVTAGAPSVGESFGASVALDAAAGVLVVGAPRALAGRGQVHVFERNGAGAWPEVARFDGAAGRERFGFDVAVEAGLALVGQPDFEGTVHVLRRELSGWVDGGDVPRPATVFAGAEFGEAVDMEGGRAVVGAPGEDSASYDSGAAYVYGQAGATFTLLERLEHPSATVVTYHGADVAIDVEGPRVRVLVGSRDDRAFLWESTGGPFQVVDVLRSHDGRDEGFGESVALDGKVALVGATRRAGTEPSSGAAVAFRIVDAGAGPEVVTQGLVHPTFAALGDFDEVGAAVAVRGNDLWIGAPRADLGAATSGALLRAGVQDRLGEAYCAGQRNSRDAVAALTARGSILAADGDLSIDAAGLPVGTTCLLIAGPDRGFAPAVGGGQGDLCLDGSLVRFNALLQFADPIGRTSMTLDFQSLPPGVSGTAGETLCFQLWYRDLDPTPTSNTSDAIEVVLR